jgi:hypothetical protein
MTHHWHSPFLAVLGSILSVLACASPAQAIIIYDFPIFGVVNVAQTARVNAVLQPPPEGDRPCPTTLAFFDEQGGMIGDPSIFELRPGVAAHADFIGDPGLRPLARIQVRAQVTIGDPGIFPGCAGGALVSVEVIDRLTHATHLIVTSPVERPVGQLVSRGSGQAFGLNDPCVVLGGTFGADPIAYRDALQAVKALVGSRPGP